MLLTAPSRSRRGSRRRPTDYRLSAARDQPAESVLHGRHQLECCRTRLRGYHRVNIRCAVGAILRSVSGINLLMEGLVLADLDKCHVFGNPSGRDTPRMTELRV